jgi:hypothetical protein
MDQCCIGGLWGRHWWRWVLTGGKQFENDGNWEIDEIRGFWVQFRGVTYNREGYIGSTRRKLVLVHYIGFGKNQKTKFKTGKLFWSF